ncbi:TPA: hypothetical protein ACXM9H_003362, partial [Burkholderia multivorans]
FQAHALLLSAVIRLLRYAELPNQIRPLHARPSVLECGHDLHHRVLLRFIVKVPFLLGKLPPKH